MVPTIVPHNVNYMAIVMEERARKPRIRDKMPSAIHSVAFGSGDGAQEMPNNAAVGFFVSPAVSRTRSHIRSHLRLYNYNSGVVLRNQI